MQILQYRSQLNNNKENDLLKHISNGEQSSNRLKNVNTCIELKVTAMKKYHGTSLVLISMFSCIMVTKCKGKVKFVPSMP